MKACLYNGVISSSQTELTRRQIARRMTAVSSAALCALLGGTLVTSQSAKADTYLRGVAGALNDTNWTDINTGATGVTPGAGDIALFNSSIGGAETNAVASTTLASPFQLGELRITNPAGAQTISDSANTLELMGVNGVALDMSSATQNLTLSAPIQIGTNNEIYNIGSGRTATFTVGLIDGGANYGFEKFGTGTLTFSDAAVNNFNGNITVNAGTLNPQFNAATNQSNNLPVTATVTLDGGILNLQQEGTQDGTPNTQALAGMSVGQGESNINWTRVSSGVMQLSAGTITRSAGGTLFFNGVSSKPTNQIAIVANTDTASNIIGGWAITDQQGFAVANATGNVTNATVTANNFSTNTLNTDVTASFAATGTVTGSLRFNTAAADTLTLSGASAIDSGGILVTTVTAGNVETITGGTLTSNNGQDLIVIDTDTTTGGALSINSSIVDNPSNSIGFTKSGGGVVLLSGSNNFTGPVYLNDGTIKLNNASALGAQNAIIFGNAAAAVGTLNLNSFSTTVSSLSTAANSTGLPSIVQNANASAATLTVGTSSGSFVFNGTLQDGAGGGPLSVTKTGNSTQTIGGTLSYTGPTNVNGGTLKLTSAITGSTLISVNSGATLDSSAVSVGLSLASGQTLNGLGTVLGTVSAGSGSIIAPGSGTSTTGGTGTLTIGSLSLAAGSIVNLGLSSTPTNNFISTGVLTLPTSGTAKVDLYTPGTSTVFATPGTYDLFQYTSIAGGNLTDLAVGTATTGLNAAFGTAGGYVTLTLSLSSTNHNWTNALGNSQWTSAGNWSPATVPSNPGDGATFSQSNATPGVVNLSSNETVGTLAFVTTTGTFNISGSSTLTFNNNGNGASIADTGTNVVSTPVALNDNLEISGGGTLTVSGAISGSKSLTPSGPGTVNMTGSNSYTGGTVVAGGTLVFSAASTGDGNLGATSTPVTIGGGTLEWAAGTTDDISSTSRVITFASGNAGLNTNGNNVTLNNPVGNNGPGGLTKTGAGTLTLNGVNTYNGPTAVNGGSLSISSNANLGNQSAGAALTMNGGTLITTATMTLDNGGINLRPVTFTGATGGNFAPASGTTLTIDGAIAGSGQLVMSGAGQITILNPVQGQNTYDGGTIINSGTILTGDMNTQSAGLGTGTVTFNGPSGTLNLEYSGSTTPTYGTFPNNIIVPTGDSGLLITTPRGDVSGTISGGGTLTIQTAYVRSQFDDNFNGFTGQLNITENDTNGGDFRLDVTTGIPNASVNIGAGTNLYDVFVFGAGGQTESLGAVSGSGELSGGPTAGRTLTWSVGGLNTSTTFSGTIADNTGPTAILKVGTGTWTLSGTNTYSGATQVSGGTLALVGGGALPPAPTLTPATGTTLTITTGASVMATNVANTPYAVVIGSLANTGTFDVGNNLLVINGTTTTIATVDSQVAAGFNGGTWNGSSGTGAIVSSAAAADTTHLTAVGAVVNDSNGNALYNSLDGDTSLVDGNILVKYTYYGDADLSGVVDGSDYSLIDNAYLNNSVAANTQLTGWHNGDFNYDGVINGSDYTLIDNAYNSQGASLESEVATPTAQISGGGASSSVPEPATLGLLGLGAVGLLGRRGSRGGRANRRHR